MAVLDSEIDGLYQLPLSEFTAARNALASRAGPRRDEIKSLQKPNTAAWAVNQLYWQRRDAYSRLLRAAEALRAAQMQAIRGGKADVAAAERTHGDVVRETIDEAVKLLASA